ncbi:hypothetical protein HYALB_00006508 [Hymenoscyphus albidus]|uniref:Glycosyl hydrolase family 13 catalytic domain-containing protein n=1 Tax=Hymenoscyphus albidus TaxID=595503 RepID=A0A9N9LQU3_9HELO|nr:hypothetical protein HYALB_00006508 [Hymenoscyphus albidus]
MSAEPVGKMGIKKVNKAWWKEATIYQIYPASFADVNGDGIGDIPGIIEKLDYIKGIGVDVIWLCPVYKSPQVDMGYDIEDYKEIHDKYGTVGDIEKLIQGCRERGLKFLMDLVVNHTSDKHYWFQESRKSKDNPYRNFYIWRPAKILEDGSRAPPNNWGAVWGGSAWEWDEQTQEYYLHIFAPEQPDLNWEHPPVRDAVHDIMRFWLDKGVDGFRMDVINFISKTPGLPDAPITRPDQKYQPGDIHFACGPRLHEYLLELGTILKEYNAFSVGEMPSVHDPKEILNAVQFDRGELNMIFHFEIVDMDHGPRGKFSPKQWSMTHLKSIVNKWQRFMLDNDGWNALYLENHDQSRSVSRWGNDSEAFRVICAKMFATFLGLQSGTVFLYQGQELGMINVPVDRPIEDYRDLETLNAWEEIIQRYPDDIALQKSTMSEIQKKSRDNARTPMQWSPTTNGGFCPPTSIPWQAPNPSYTTINASTQVSSPDSVYTYWNTILSLRKSHTDIFVYGDFRMIDGENDDIFAYVRTFEGKKVLVANNFRDRDVRWTVPEGMKVKGEGVLVSNYGVLPEVKEGVVVMRDFEGFAVFVE